MANRRCFHALTRHAASLFPKTPSLRSLDAVRPLKPVASAARLISEPTGFDRWSQTRHFASNKDDGNSEDDVEDEDDEEEGDWESSDDEDVSGPSGVSDRVYTPAEKLAEAAVIGYRVLGPVEKPDEIFKPYEPVFAIIQIGSQQFKVSNDDCLYVEKLRFCNVNDKIVLEKVLLLGSSSQTIVGRPTVPDATVHAVVEEHALDAKVIIFKKKRRKNYRRCKGHRQELTKLRIIDIQGIEKPKAVDTPKPLKTWTPGKKQENVAVAA